MSRTPDYTKPSFDRSCAKVILQALITGKPVSPKEVQAFLSEEGVRWNRETSSFEATSEAWNNDGTQIGSRITGIVKALGFTGSKAESSEKLSAKEMEYRSTWNKVHSVAAGDADLLATLKAKNGLSEPPKGGGDVRFKVLGIPAVTSGS
jgi:hypothetical protein